MLSRDYLSIGEWKDYELIDSGEHMKLECFGDIVLARPETQAIWEKQKPEVWGDADASFSFGEGGKGKWNKKPDMPEEWQIGWEDARFILKLTAFKHIGIFPEQASQWGWIREQTKKLEAPKVLNLFGYTGAASVVAAQAGASVTHVDASKQSIQWAKENAEASGLSDDSIRWILDDALVFTKREVRREAKYDGIILDPPAFGRGPKGEVWHIEESLPELMAALKELLSDKSGAFLILNGYAAGYTPQSFKQLVEGSFGDVSGQFGELQLPESSTTRHISSGIYTRFVR
ncbi:hypothetical protein FJY94_01855 [Candidatus Kaiserbacteria bacterium]|nr:hypothetical protein [Candidatus Kaiserbacteria bacterium]